MRKIAEIAVLYSLCPAIFMLAYVLWDKIPLAVSYLLLGCIAIPVVLAAEKLKGN